MTNDHESNSIKRMIQNQIWQTYQDYLHLTRIYIGRVLRRS